MTCNSIKSSFLSAVSITSSVISEFTHRLPITLTLI